MEIMKEIMLKKGIDLDKMKKDFFSNGDDWQKSIQRSKEFIVYSCKAEKKSIWEFVQQEMLEIDNNKEYGDNNSEYQKHMIKISLLLAWEDLELKDFILCHELWKESRKNN